MIPNQHDVADFESGVHSTRRIGQDYGFHTESWQNPLGISHHIHRIAFIIMETAVENQHLHPIQSSENHRTLVSMNRGDREIGNLLVRNFLYHINFRGDSTQAGA